uniref:Putative LOC100634292 [Amphimedon queenslandica] n=1 Tax=Lepeophtheirus salmonis TaxID=72036 RepID=A0A0K2TXQ1_LEPSM
MVTLHSFVGYFMQNTGLKHVNFAVISDCNTHDTVSVHLYIKKYIKCVKETWPYIH